LTGKTTHTRFVFLAAGARLTASRWAARPVRPADRQGEYRFQGLVSLTPGPRAPIRTITGPS